MVKIVPEADAKLQGGSVAQGSFEGGGDRLVTQVLPLKYESAAQLVNVLRPLITPNNTIAAFPNGNALVITDYADNLRRINRIIATLDQPPQGEPVLIPVRHASAVDLVAMLNRLVGESQAAGGGAADGQQRVAMIADGRSNSILVRSDNPGRVARVRQLIEQLDTPGRAGGNIYIIYLKNAEAARVAQTLRALLTGGGDAGGQRRPAALAPVAAGVGAGGREPARNRAGDASASAPQSAAQGFSAGGATIQADIANNALIIAAPEPVYNNLRAVIEKLDVRRAQVYVEALIVEVAADRAAELGVQWQVLGGINKDSPQGFGGTNFGARGSGNNIIEGSLNLGSLGQGLNLGVVNGSVTIPGLGLITNLALLIRALETDSSAQHPVDAHAAHARQRGGEDRRRAERAVHHRAVHDGSQQRRRRHAVPDHRAPGRRPHAAGEAADHRGRQHPPRRLPGSLARRLDQQSRRGSSPTSARSSRR